MATILDTIVSAKRAEVGRAQLAVPISDLERQVAALGPPRHFRAALDRPGSVQVIAEVKKRSPAAGILDENFDAPSIAREYEAHGAAAISVLTDQPYFGGSLADLSAVRATVQLPVLRKDFVIDRYQLLEARLAGADAVLLIAEVLAGTQLHDLVAEAKAFGLECLVELYEPENLPRVVDSGARVIGINNRDLRTFTTALEHTLTLAPRVPPDCCLVSESGIRTRDDVLRLQEAGVRAVLVGETLMRARDRGRALGALLGHGP